MFGQLMESVSDEFVKYVMHAQVVVDEDTRPAVSNVTVSGPDDPSDAVPAVARAAVGPAPAEGAAPVEAPEPDAPAQQPVVKSDWDKTPRNAPCPCGSGKKFKQCHGAA
jgi:preprotein translocase subunit SecA